VTEGHTRTRLKPAPSARAGTNEVLEVLADRMQAKLPGAGATRAEILAEGNLVVTRGTQRATGARLVYSGSATNGQANLTGDARWSAQDVEGGADSLVFDREHNAFSGQGNGWIRAKRGAAQPGQPAPFLDAHADRYEYQGDTAILTGHVRAEDPQWRLTCGELRLRNAPGTNRLEQVLAREGVIVEQAAVAKGQIPWRLNARQARMDMSPDGRQMSRIVAEEQIVIEPARLPLAGEQGLPWRLHCDRLTLALAGEGGRLDNVLAENHIRIEPTVAAGQKTEFPWKLDCDRLTLFMVPDRTNQVDRVLAEQNVVLEQTGGERRNGWWKLASGRALLHFGEGQQVREAEAEQQVRATQFNTQGLAAWVLTSAKATLKMGESNRVERVTANENVLLEQGLTTNGLPVKLRCETASVDLGASNTVRRIAAREKVIFEQGDSRATGGAGDYDTLTGDVQLTDHPLLVFVEDAARTPAGQAPHQIEVSNANVLIWNRLSNHFRGRGPYTITPKGPLKGLKP
jgi:hypothetical protein